MTLTLATDCRHYQGDRPCVAGKRCRCDEYAPMGMRILIIKLGALGDVVRTTALVPTLKNNFPVSHITWISKASGVRVLKNDPRIDCLVEFNAEGILRMTQQEFDLVLSLDKEPAPAALCKAVSCEDKRGMILSRYGTVEPINRDCEDYFELGLDNHLKFHVNTLSYPELIHRAVGLSYEHSPYQIFCSDEEIRRMEEILKPVRQTGNPVIGLNTGSGSVFANKSLSRVRWVELARMILSRGWSAVILGGREEKSINAWIAEQSNAFYPGVDFTETEFSGLAGLCDVVVTGDTFGLHAAVGRGAAVAALFGPTSAVEIDLYERGRKIISPVNCAPCYKRQCERKPSCMDMISLDEIISSVESLLGVSASFEEGRR
jgi:heptosyltransferase-2